MGHVVAYRPAGTDGGLLSQNRSVLPVCRGVCHSLRTGFLSRSGAVYGLCVPQGWHEGLDDSVGIGRYACFRQTPLHRTTMVYNSSEKWKGPMDGSAEGCRGGRRGLDDVQLAHLWQGGTRGGCRCCRRAHPAAVADYPFGQAVGERLQHLVGKQWFVPGASGYEQAVAPDGVHADGERNEPHGESCR